MLRGEEAPNGKKIQNLKKFNIYEIRGPFKNP